MKINNRWTTLIPGMFLAAFTLISCESDTSLTPKDNNTIASADATVKSLIIPVDPPAIKFLTPSSGYAATSTEDGSALLIFGANFGDDPTVTVDEVRINGVKADVLQGEDNRILVFIPEGATTGRVTVAARGFVATSDIDFIVGPRDAPIIEGFTPEDGAEVGDTVRILGENFDNINIQNNIVKFNGVQAVVTAATDRAITTTVPVGATSGGRITVTKNGFTVFSSLGFVVKPTTVPLEILNVFPNAFNASQVHTGSAITVITGTGFSTTPFENQVIFNGGSGSVLSASPTSLVVALPTTAVTGLVSVFTNGVFVTSPSPIFIL